MRDHLRFVRDLVDLRRRYPALRGDAIHVYHVHGGNRVLAFQRWIDGTGGDVVVVCNLSEATWSGYEVGLPSAGRWLEVFNSDVYDHWVNPMVAGNEGSVLAAGPPLHGLPSSAAITIPANGFVVFARD